MNVCPRLRRSAFTLIELLTVIAIIGILAGIMIPTMGKVRRSANDAQCKTALRQWGMAIQLYIDDNKGRLPGPCGVGQGRSIAVLPEIYDKDNRSLFSFLAPYVQLKNNNSTLLPDAFVCSAWLRDTPKANGIVYYLRLNGDANYFPWGWAGNGNPGTPKLYTEVINNPDYHSRPALIDFDCDFIAADWSDRAPLKPVHGNHRNALFYNWRVGTMPVGPKPTQ